jgi:hypothetical protein
MGLILVTFLAFRQKPVKDPARRGISWRRALVRILTGKGRKTLTHSPTQPPTNRPDVVDNVSGWPLGRVLGFAALTPTYALIEVDSELLWYGTHGIAPSKAYNVIINLILIRHIQESAHSQYYIIGNNSQ